VSPLATLSPSDTAEALRGSAFRHTGDHLAATFRTGNFATGARLVAIIAEVAERMNHHPDLTLTFSSLGVELSSHDAGGVTERDVELARHIDTAAEAVGADASVG
jgi:4a-hydroxytetrahydrobiopterin dehydratase